MSMMPNKRLTAAGRMIIGVSVYGLRGCMLSIFRGKIHQNRHPKSGSLMMPDGCWICGASTSWVRERVIGCVSEGVRRRDSRNLGPTLSPSTVVLCRVSLPVFHRVVDSFRCKPCGKTRRVPRLGGCELHKCTSRQQRIHSIDCVAVQWLLKRSRN